MKVSKKRLAQIRLASVYEPLLNECKSFCHLKFDDPPDMWSTEQKDMFDLLTGIEDKLKEEIIDIIERKQ